MDNESEIGRFLELCRATGLSRQRIRKYELYLGTISRKLGMPFREAQKDDIIRVMSWVQSSEYSDWTKNDFKIMIKRFYKWLEGDDEEVPKKVRWIKSSTKYVTIPKEILTMEEVYGIMEQSVDDETHLFVSLLWETGCRRGEMLGIMAKNVTFECGFATIIVDGKTGPRAIPVFECVDELKERIKKLKSDNPIFTKCCGTFRARIRKAADNLSIKKKLTLHLFRHSRATFLANYLTEAQMDKFFGWEMGSKMPRIYVHLAAVDIKEAMIRVHQFLKMNAEISQLKPDFMFG